MFRWMIALVLAFTAGYGFITSGDRDPDDVPVIEELTDADDSDDDDLADAAEPGGPADADSRNDGGAPEGAAHQSRPPLVIRQGQAYRWAAPRDWRATEGQNVLEIGAPDGLTGVSMSYVLGMFGQATPSSYLRMVVQSAGYQNLRVLSYRDLPPENSVIPGMPWQLGYTELAYTYRGVPVRAAAISGVIQGAGQYVATVLGWQAPEPEWANASGWLPRVARSIVITDASWAVTMARSSLPRNIPHDYIYGNYNRAWTARGVSEARLSQMRREGTMGYEEMQSPATGERYDMPLDLFDSTIGGYRNPDRPREVLVRPPELRR